MKKYIFIVLMFATISACKDPKNSDGSEVSKNYEQIDELNWILGKWTNEFTPEFSQEAWRKKNDSTYTAFSFTTVRGDTVFAENMTLQQNGKNLGLTVQTVNSKDIPVTFTKIPSKKGQFVFENKTNDFPQRIFYTHPAADSLHAWIEGPVEGENQTLHFHFSKKK